MDKELGNKLVKEARTWLDTPWRHNQKCKGHAVDCVQLVVGTCQSQGIPIGNLKNYYRTPRGNSLLNYIKELPNTRLIDEDYRSYQLQPGQLLLFIVAKVPHHVGFATGSNTFIHADQASGKVTEHSLGGWRRKIAAVFDIIK